MFVNLLYILQHEDFKVKVRRWNAEAPEHTFIIYTDIEENNFKLILHFTYILL